MTQPSTDQAGLISTLRSIGEVSDARSSEIRDLRRLPTDIVERLIDSGVFRTWVPIRYGGVTPDIAYTTGLEFNF